MPGPGPIASVEIAPDDTTLTSVDATIELLATARDSDGDIVAGARFEWITSGSEVAAVDETDVEGIAVVTATGEGTATITATADDVSGTATVQVQQAVGRVEITPPEATLEVGETIQLTATAGDPLENSIPNVMFEWGSSDSSVATVDTTGLVEGISEGLATISATTDGVSGNAEITVVSAEPGASLECGDLIAGSIDAPAEADTFTFDAGAGDIVALTIVETSSWGSFRAARSRLVSPTGTEILIFDSNAQPEIELPESGLYSVLISANDLSATGTYNLGHECILPTGDDAVPISPGDLLSGSLDERGESDLYTVEVEAGDIVAMTVVETSSWGSFRAARVTLFSPSGEEFTSFDSNSQPEITLPESGTYVVRVSGNDLLGTGSYNLGLEGILPMSPNPTPLAPGDLLSGSLDERGESDLYTVEVEAGDIVAMTVVETSSWGSFRAARVTLFSPSGEEFTSFDSNSQPEITLPESGTYVVRVSGNDLLGTGSYNLGLEGILPTSPSPTLMSCDDLLAGSTASPGESDLFLFAGNSDQDVTITIVETSNWGSFAAARATLFSPAGLEILSVDSDGQADTVLDASGDYLVRVSANNLVATGSYDLGLECP